MYIDKKVHGVSFYYKVKAFGLICRYIFVALGILLMIVLALIRYFAG